MRFTGVVSGRSVEITNFYHGLLKIFKKNHINPPFHWSKISRKVKQNTKKDIISLINESKLNFNVIQHKPSASLTKKELYFSRLPKSIAEHLEYWLKNKGGDVKIEVDDDYNIKNHKSNELVESLIIQIGYRLVGKHIKIRFEDEIKATLKQENGKIMNFYGKVTQIKTSTSIQIIDIVLGLVNEGEKGINKSRLYCWKI